mgnify:CR=1 FL=1
MGVAWRAPVPAGDPPRSRHIADYIAGMTDRFAIAAHARIYGRTVEGLSNV